MIAMKNQLAVLILLILSALANANVSPDDPNKIDDIIAQEMDTIRQGKPPLDRSKLIEQFGCQLIPVMEKYLNDPDNKVRLYAYDLLRLVGLRSMQQSERRKVVELLVNQLNDREHKNFVAGRLLSFEAADFSEAAKKILHDKLATLSDMAIVRVVGVADMKADLPLLDKIIRQEEKKSVDPRAIQLLGFNPIIFHIKMAKARMGVKEDIIECINMAESIPDENLKINTLFDKLPYIRQPEVVKHLMTYL